MNNKKKIKEMILRDLKITLEVEEIDVFEVYHLTEQVSGEILHQQILHSYTQASETFDELVENHLSRDREHTKFLKEAACA